MRNRSKKQKRVFEVTIGQTLIVLIMTAIALAAMFEVGILVGKKRLIRAERETVQQNDMQMTEAKSPDRAIPIPPAGQPEIGRNAGPVSDKVAPPEQKSPSSTAPDQSTNQSGKVIYTVQIGVFGSRQNAESLFNLLGSYEYEPWIMSITGEEKTLHYVFIGRFGTRDEADRFGKLMLQRLSYLKEYKVSKIEG